MRDRSSRIPAVSRDKFWSHDMHPRCREWPTRRNRICRAKRIQFLGCTRTKLPHRNFPENFPTQLNARTFIVAFAARSKEQIASENLWPRKVTCWRSRCAFIEAVKSSSLYLEISFEFLNHGRYTFFIASCIFQWMYILINQCIAIEQGYKTMLFMMNIKFLLDVLLSEIVIQIWIAEGKARILWDSKKYRFFFHVRISSDTRSTNFRRAITRLLRSCAIKRVSVDQLDLSDKCSYLFPVAAWRD